ncbi:MAG: hypothetical protein WDN01_07975 [Rhizomicrobium sp.]
MDVGDALKILGSKTVVWIDDKFNDTSDQLAGLLLRNREIASGLGFQELAETFALAQVDEDRANIQMADILGSLDLARLKAIRKAFFEQENIAEQFPTNELSDEAVSQVCKVLQVPPENRWTFDRAAEEIQKVQDGDDDGTTYIVDLNEAGGSSTRGLEILQQLWTRKSKGNPFILTHEATVATEGQREAELRATLARDGGDALGLPICVIAKERLFDFENAEALNTALVTAIKRAGLRRSLFEVIDRARGKIDQSFRDAADKLLSVPPEQLEAFVFERGYKEGVSELHVVERIITAQLGQDMRMFFGTDEAALRSVYRLRDLREIPLPIENVVPDENLARFRKAEIWEDEELINRSYSPIACGDVFEYDRGEKETAANPRRFVVLAQPCDIALRPNGKRAHDLAFLAQLKKGDAAQATGKVYPLPFKLDGEQWLCSFHDVTVVRLSVLDLASFRHDGRVRVDDGHGAPHGLLASQHKIYGRRTAPATKVLAAATAVKGGGLLTDGLQLCVSQDSPFKKVFCPTFEPVRDPKPEDDPSDNLKRVTWRLRRRGRIRHPYVAALLDQYLEVIGRHAFDLDFMDVDIVNPAESEASAVVESSAAPIAAVSGGDQAQ